MSPLRVLFLSHNSTRNGAVRVIINLANHWVKNGWAKCQFLLGQPIEDSIIQEFEKLGTVHLTLDTVPFSPGEFDLVYNNTATNGILLDLLEVLKTPIITHVHELGFALESIRPEILSSTLQHSHHYIACSEKIRDLLITYYSIPKQNISQVHDFISISEIKPKRLKPTHKNNTIHIGTIANMDYRKGIDIFLHMIEQIPELLDDRPLHWTWVGEHGQYYQQLLSPQQQQRVCFSGPMDNPWDKVENIDFYFSFSREDPFPLSVLEALSRNIPVGGFEGSGGIDELTDAGWAMTCEQEPAKVFETIKHGISRNNDLFGSKPFPWESRIASREIFKVCKKFLRPFQRRLFRKKLNPPQFNIPHMSQPLTLLQTKPCQVNSPSQLLSTSCFRSQSKEFHQHSSQNSNSLLVSIITPVHNPKPEFLKKAIQSVISQNYHNWELILVDDASKEKKTLDHARAAAAGDSRIRLISNSHHRHISETTNKGIQSATGEWIGFLDQDDELHPDALLDAVTYIHNNPKTQILYTDEDKIDENNGHYDPYLKPDWNPALLRSQNYFCHFVIICKELLNKVGQLRAGVEGAQDWDLCLRATELIGSKNIGHVPKILYHWRSHKGSSAKSLEEKGAWVKESSQKTLQDHLDRTGFKGTPIQISGGHWRILYENPVPLPYVSIFFYGAEKRGKWNPDWDDIIRKIQYPNLDWHIPQDWVTHNWTPRWNSNEAISNQAKGDIVIFLQSGVEPVHPNWLMELVSQCMREETGLCGPRLIHPATSRVVSAGMQLVDGQLLSLYEWAKLDDPGDKNRAHLTQNFDFLHPACIAGRREHFHQLREISEAKLISLCKELIQAGFWNIFSPNSQCYRHPVKSPHFEQSKPIVID